MTKATIVRIIGSVASAVVASSALFLPQQYRAIALALATFALGALHVPRPGDVPDPAVPK